MIIRYILVGLIGAVVCLVWGLSLASCQFVVPWCAEMARGSFWEVALGIGGGLAFTMGVIGGVTLSMWAATEVGSRLIRKR